MHLRAVIEYDEVVKSYSAYCPELPGCTSCGDTEAEAMANIREAIELYLEPDDIPFHKGRQLPIGTLKSIIDGSGLDKSIWSV